MKTINLLLRVWRQAGSDLAGFFETHQMGPLSVDMSFLEMLDVLNEMLTLRGEEPVAFDSDCREGICGMCGAVVNGFPHGPERETTLCQLHLRHFRDGDTIVIEPFPAGVFKPIKDLVVDRSVLDGLMGEGGYVSVNTGQAPEANTIAIPPEKAEEALDAAECIGCGACVAACPNSAAMLFVGAKVSHLALLPQGGAERNRRVLSMVRLMDKSGFGGCGNLRECEKACPKGVSIKNIARLNREYIRASLRHWED